MGWLPNELIPDSHVSQTKGSQIGDTDSAQDVGSSSGPITIVVMTLFLGTTDLNSILALMARLSNSAVYLTDITFSHILGVIGVGDDRRHSLTRPHT